MIRASLGAAKPRRPMKRTPMKRGRTRVGRAAAARRKAGGKLAVGRASGTRESLSAERAYVQQRAKGLCEVRMDGLTPHPGTDFAHVVARSQGGQDDRYNALWLCRAEHRRMEASFAKGRLVVTRISVNGARGFDWEYVTAADKHAYRRGEFKVLAAGFVRAEIEG